MGVGFPTGKIFTNQRFNLEGFDRKTGASNTVYRRSKLSMPRS